MVEEGRFRRDLYYRINVFPIEIPPLRHRSGDIAKLAWHFAKKYAKRMNKRIEKIRSEDMAVLVDYSWPGNIRELQNFMERSVILSRDTMLHMPLGELNRARLSTRPGVRTLAEPERDHILQTLRETEWVGGGPHGAYPLGQNASARYLSACLLTGACQHFVRVRTAQFVTPNFVELPSVLTTSL